MSFAKKPDRVVAKPNFRGAAPTRLSLSLLVRTLVFAAVAIAGAVWALTRHYTHELPPLRRPVTPATAPTYDPDAGEIPVPDLE